MDRQTEAERQRERVRETETEGARAASRLHQAPAIPFRDGGTFFSSATCFMKVNFSVIEAFSVCSPDTCRARERDIRLRALRAI